MTRLIASDGRLAVAPPRPRELDCARGAERAWAMAIIRLAGGERSGSLPGPAPVASFNGHRWRPVWRYAPARLVPDTDPPRPVAEGWTRTEYEACAHCGKRGQR